MPKTVAVASKTFVYDYDAGGNKHKYAGDTVNFKYAGAFEYDASNVLKRVATSEGQLVPSGDTLRFDYFLKDNLGNTRLIFDEKGDILQSTDYYPFGLEIDRNQPVVGLNARNSLNRKLYLGKELQVGTGYLDLSRRFFDPTIGRFMQVDPVTDTQENYSTYQYGWNNPILRSDPNGDCPMCIGALIGVVTDVALQSVEIALDDEKSFLKDFSYASVAVSAVAGATGVGLASKIGKLGTVAKLGIELAHDATAAAASQYVTEAKVDAKLTLVNAVAGKVVGDIAGNVAGKQAAKSTEGKVLAKQANRIERVAANNPRTSRTEAAKQATQKAANYVERRSVAASTASSGVAGNIVTKVLEEDKTKKQK